ncbi:MAG TPA: hypothetical protein VN578_05090 [Candidatus Binatia bacterium]|jgi:hypothetical protein|nr:hypothetical protein [Candidatus Binatia bacterium]
MSTLPDNEFDLEKLFLPAWAQETPSSVKYAQYQGEAERPERRGDRRGPRPPRREGGPGGRQGPPGGRREGNRPGGERGPRRPGERPGRPAEGDRFGPRRGQIPERREPPRPLPEINLNLVPDERGVESLARQIKMTGRAYPLFDIAQMILQKPERHAVVFGVRKNPEGKPLQPLFVCALDETLWLAEDEAVAHVLRKHFTTFYQAEKTATEPPKGKYTFVAQCGMSGVILGPPNHHDYQNQLRKLHTERFSRMPFEMYKARVKIVRDEEVVKKWVEDQSWKTEYVCLNLPEPLRLGTMEAVEKHFRENHKDNIIKPVETHTLIGTAARALRSPELTRLVRSVWEDQRRFPLQIATVLSQQFATHGLQFFKVNKTITHVSVARPHYLDMALTPVSEGVKRIVDYINSNSKCTRRQLFGALAPAPVPAPIPVPPAAVEGKPPSPPESPEPTAEQTAVIADLHWLIHQGHVIEFANGVLDTAKKPLPRPPKPAAKPGEKPPEAASQTETIAAGEANPAELEAENGGPAPATDTAPQAAEAAVAAPASESPPVVPAEHTAPGSENPAAAPEIPASEPPPSALAAEAPAEPRAPALEPRP